MCPIRCSRNRTSSSSSTRAEISHDSESKRPPFGRPFLLAGCARKNHMRSRKAAFRRPFVRWLIPGSANDTHTRHRPLHPFDFLKSVSRDFEKRHETRKSVLRRDGSRVQKVLANLIRRIGFNGRCIVHHRKRNNITHHYCLLDAGPPKATLDRIRRTIALCRKLVIVPRQRAVESGPASVRNLFNRQTF